MMFRRNNDDMITVAVPPQRMRWLYSQLDASGIPYQDDGRGNVTTLEMAQPIIEQVLGYEAKQPRKPGLMQRLKAFAQEQIYFVEEMIVFIAVGAALIAGVKFFGLGQLDPTFAILFRSGTDLPLIRAVGLLVVAIVVLIALTKSLGKPAGGVPRGIGTYRILSVLLIGGLVVALVWMWMGGTL
jgi:hypothetical protein